MGALADSVTADLLDDLEQSFESIGGEIVAEIREEISVPVELVRGTNVSKQMRALYGSKFDRVYIRPRLSFKGSESNIRRSVKGEPPRRETGRLWEGVRMEITRDADSVTLDVLDDVFYGWILENSMDRPFFSTAWDKWRDAAPGMIVIRTDNI